MCQTFSKFVGSKTTKHHYFMNHILMESVNISYESPQIEVLELQVEGVLCESTLEGVGENYGTW